MFDHNELNNGKAFIEPKHIRHWGRFIPNNELGTLFPKLIPCCCIWVTVYSIDFTVYIWAIPLWSMLYSEKRIFGVFEKMDSYYQMGTRNSKMMALAMNHYTNGIHPGTLRP